MVTLKPILLLNGKLEIEHNFLTSYQLSKYKIVHFIKINPLLHFKHFLHFVKVTIKKSPRKSNFLMTKMYTKIVDMKPLPHYVQ